MTAVAKLRTRHSHLNADLTWSDTDDPIWIPCEREIGLMLECEMIRPRSSEGRTVHVVISPEQQLGLLRVLKDEMRRQRSQPDPQGRRS